VATSPGAGHCCATASPGNLLSGSSRNDPGTVTEHGKPVPGARFEGRNRSSGGFEWTTTCVVTQAERPSVFERVVLDSARDLQRPGAIWRYELVPGSAGQTIVRHSFVHGPAST
jgi:hypothetical protein